MRGALKSSLRANWTPLLDAVESLGSVEPAALRGGISATFKPLEAPAGMICLHAIFRDGALHVFGEQPIDSSQTPARATLSESNPPAIAHAPAADVAPDPGVGRDACEVASDARDGCETAEHATQGDAPATTPPAYPLGASVRTLRQCMGDLWDGLLVSGADAATLVLQLPFLDGCFLPSPGMDGADVTEADRARVVLRSATVETLRFSPADAVDFLMSIPWFEKTQVRRGGSLRYWSQAAAFVLELLARQRFVPDLYRTGPDIYRGYWRVVTDDASTSKRIETLIVSMPTLCRSAMPDGQVAQASSLIENFLWTTVDALVRRSLEGDELVHALPDHGANSRFAQTLWVRSLVTADPVIAESPEGCGQVWRAVRRWLAAIEPQASLRSCRTCFRLVAPAPPPPGATHDDDGAWRLDLFVQATGDKKLVVPAAQLWQGRTGHPLILQRPFMNARQQLRDDLAMAARHFEPLSRCLESTEPVACPLSLAEAHLFLRDAALILEAEGFGVWLPDWWDASRPRLGVRLDIEPVAPPAGGSAPTMSLDAIVHYDWRVALGDEVLSPDEIRALAREKAPLVALRGRWTEVQAADVDAALSFVSKELGGEMTLLEALRVSYLADDLATGLPIVGLHCDGWVRDLLDADLASERLEATDPPVAFCGEMRAYQLRGLAWLMFVSRHGLGACLADDMGLGKTIQLIALWLKEREGDQQPGPTLLVVPMSLVGNWHREIQRFGPSLRVLVHHGLDRLSGQALRDQAPQHDVVISTYGLIHRDFEHLARVTWHRIALDEAQNIKNPVAKQARAVRALKSVHRLALTGTPVENHLSELWAIFEFLNPGYLGSARAFRRRFAIPIQRQADAPCAHRLRQLIRPFVLRRKKGDPNVLVDLPERMEMKVYCNLTREQAALYQAVVDDMLAQIDHSGGMQRRGLILATLVKLKQICNHPAHYLGDQSAMPHRSGKCDRLCEMLTEVVAEDDRALVFTQYRVMGDLLQAHLQETLDREILFFHGGTTQRNRDTMIMRFQEGTAALPVLLLSLKAGGVGLNLTAANHVFHFDRWWNPAVEQQATDRVHRIGQTRRVLVHKFVCLGTLEERIDSTLERKRSLAENIIGTGEEWMTELTTGALRDLFALSREAIADD